MQANGDLYERRMASQQPPPADDPPGTPGRPDSYFENGLLVFTAAYHLERGYCCGSGCRHCPYEPRHIEGNTKIRT